jgi:hypothetical protein
MIRLRSDRTLCATAWASVIRTRDSGAPAKADDSTTTAAIGLLASGRKRLTTPTAPTLRKSTSTVSGSGRVATYAAGSLASMTTAVPALSTRVPIALNRARGSFVPGLGPAPLTSAPARTTATATHTPTNHRLPPLTSHETWSL